MGGGVLPGRRPVCSMTWPDQRDVLFTQAEFRYQKQCGGCPSFLSASGLAPGAGW